MSTDSNEQFYEFCPRCEANLTLQKGYSNDLPYWICKGCGEMLINPDVDGEGDIAWICDKCGAMLNVQEGFAGNDGKWRCTCCGFVNDIDEKNLYDTDEAYQADLHNPYRGLSDEDVLYLSSFREEREMGGGSQVALVTDPESGTRYIRKYLTVYDKSIYEFLWKNPVEHMPRIIFLAEGSNCLIVLEEYIEGETVEELISSGKLVEKEALGIVSSVCSVLGELHVLPNPIVHRDVKPSNVIVTPDKDVYLLDMNAAKWYDPDKLNVTTCFGTRFYAAPEQLGYGLTASSSKSDIYSLGVMLNVMLTGDVPQNKRAPEPYWQIILKCINLEPDERYTAPELLDALNRVINGG